MSTATRRSKSKLTSSTPRYDEAIRLIEEFHAIVEQIDDLDLLRLIIDRNIEAERQICEVRLRADRNLRRLTRAERRRAARNAANRSEGCFPN